MIGRTKVALAQGTLAFLGCLIAGYIYIDNVRYGNAPCILPLSPSSESGCTRVETSAYSHIGSIDLSLLGLGAYLALTFLAIVRGTAVDKRYEIGASWLIAALSCFGFCFSWFLQWEAKYVIHAFCINCRISAIIMSMLFLVSLLDRLCFLANKKSLPKTLNQ
jgi:uncharacterized membrane protein